MAVTCGFFNALEHDRLYDAIQMSSIFDGIIRDGIFSTIGTSMAVTASGSGLVVNVGAGRAWFNHTWILNDTLYPVEAEAAEVVLDRIDALVIEINQSAEIRDCSIKFVKGTPSSRPVRPTMTHNAEVNQYALAYISIRAGQTTIFQADITSVIGNDETPFVTGLLQQTSIESIVAQWQDEFYTYFNNFRSTTTSDFNTWMAARVAEYNAWYASMEAEGQADLAEFDSWFQEMKDQLSEDAAGHLQAEIDALELSAEKGSVVIVTTSDDTLINHACTISQGSSERNATFDINRVATFESIPFVGDMNITATNGTLIASKDINIPYFGRYNYDLEFWEATLAISSSSTELYERPITITKGGTTVGTTSFDNTGHATFKVHEPGTYTVTSTATGGAVFTANVEVTAETSYSVDLGTPIGATALPTDDIQLWLKCGGEYNVTYTTLAEVLADTELFARLCADSNACDYMARSTTWALAEGSVPTMTDDTHPSGVAFEGPSAHESYPAYLAFDGDATTFAHTVNTSQSIGWLGYEYPTPVVVNKADITFYNDERKPSSIIIQGSNDGTTYTDLITVSVSQLVNSSITFNNTTAYKYYRFYCTGMPQASGSYGIAVTTAQLYPISVTTDATAMQIVGMFDYCAEALLADDTWAEAIGNSVYFESVLNVKVPIMTGYTTPSGEVIYSSQYNTSQFLAWHAFDGSDSTQWQSTQNSNQYIGYHFTSSVLIKKIDIKRAVSGTAADTMNIKVSDDGVTWETIGNDTLTTSTDWQSFILQSNAQSKPYIRIDFADYLGGAGLTRVQFYGRTKTVEYTPLVPTMTSNTTPSGEVTSNQSPYGGQLYNAFDRNTNTSVYWTQFSGDYPWIAYEFETPQVVTKASAQFAYSGTYGLYAKSIAIEAYDTETSQWNTLYTETLPNSDIGNREFTFSNSRAYKKYRLRFTDAAYANNNFQIHTLQFYSIAEGITIHSAANDTIYYLDGSTPVTVAVTDANGRAIIDTEDLDPGTYTLYSTVAKNPNNLSNAYSKTVKIDGNTTEMYLMPIMSLYWYGNLCEWLTGGQNLAGWTNSVAGTSIGNGTANTNNYTSGGVSAGIRGYGTVNKIDITDFDSLKIILTAVSDIYYGCYLQASANKSTVTSLDATPLSPQPATRITNTGIGTLDISSYSGEYGIAEYAYHTSTNTMTALWLE